MITKMRVERFRAIRDVTVRLGDFNVLIGPNDQGKTSFLEGVYAMAASTRNPINESFWSPWRGRNLVHHGDSNGVCLTASLDDQESSAAIEYGLVLQPRGDDCIIAQELINGELVSRDFAETLVRRHRLGNQVNPQFTPLLNGIVERLPTPTLTRWDIEELAATSLLPPQRKQAVDPTGFGLATCLAEQKLADDETYQTIMRRFCELFPEFSGIGFHRVAGQQQWTRDARGRRVPTGSGDGFEMFFSRRDGVDVPAGLASGGTLVALAFLTVAELNGGLLLVEEPENGLHPSRLRDIVEILRRVCAARPGNQVILTTHSPLLLDQVEPEEVRLFVRDEKNDVQVHHLEDVPDIKDRLKYAMLGELVFSEWDNFMKEVRDYAHSGPGRRTE